MPVMHILLWKLMKKDHKLEACLHNLVRPCLTTWMKIELEVQLNSSALLGSIPSTDGVENPEIF